VDMDVYKPAEKERSGVVFIGNNFENSSHNFPLSIERAAMVEYLQNVFPDQFKVYGGNWNGSPMLMQKGEIEVLQSAAIAINQNNFDEELYTSDRIWRILATGALCLTKYFVGMRNCLLVTSTWTGGSLSMNYQRKYLSICQIQYWPKKCPKKEWFTQGNIIYGLPE